MPEACDNLSATTSLSTFYLLARPSPQVQPASKVRCLVSCSIGTPESLESPGDVAVVYFVTVVYKRAVSRDSTSIWRRFLWCGGLPEGALGFPLENRDNRHLANYNTMFYY